MQWTVTVLGRVPNAGITVVVSDDRSLVLSASLPGVTRGQERVNAISLAQPVFDLPEGGPESKGMAREAQVADAIQTPALERMNGELKRDPAPRRAAVELIRAFDAHFEFVELKLVGTAVERKTVPIPPEVLGLAADPEMRDRMRATFRLIGSADTAKFFGEPLAKERQEIAEACLVHLPGYGAVVLRPRKRDLIDRVAILQQKVEAFQASLTEAIQDVADAHRRSLVATLLPSVRQNPPPGWDKSRYDSTDDHVRTLLDRTLAKAFGGLGRMEVRCIFKGATAELLTDPRFLATASEKIPTFSNLVHPLEVVKLFKTPGGTVARGTPEIAARTAPGDRAGAINPSGKGE